MARKHRGPKAKHWKMTTMVGHHDLIRALETNPDVFSYCVYGFHPKTGTLHTFTSFKQRKRFNAIKHLLGGVGPYVKAVVPRVPRVAIESIKQLKDTKEIKK